MNLVLLVASPGADEAPLGVELEAVRRVLARRRDRATGLGLV